MYIYNIEREMCATWVLIHHMYSTPHMYSLTRSVTDSLTHSSTHALPHALTHYAFTHSLCIQIYAAL